MDPSGALAEIRKVMILSKVFDSFLNAMLIFGISALLLVIFRVYWWLALFPALGYFLYSVYIAFKRTRYQEIEERVPELRWQLRTVADNINRTDEVTTSLKASVLEKIKRVGSSYFFDPKRATYKAIGIFGVAFFIVLVGIVHLQFIEFVYVNPNAISDAVNRFGDQLTGSFGSGDQDVASNDRNIYGKESIIPLGTQALELKITPQQNKADISDVKDVKDNEFGGQGAIGEIDPAGGSSYSGEKNVKGDEADIIKNYFETLNEEGNA